MFRLFIILSCLFSYQVNADEIKNKIYDSAGAKISEKVSDLIPGDGITEVSIEKRSSEDFNFSILGVRDILYNNNSNFFTQFGLFNSQVFNDDRVTGNLGLGYRVLTPDENFLLGLNTFYDQEIKGVHSRMSIGAEIKASIIDINANNYMKVTDMKLINDTKEQVLSGFDFNVSTQLPYSPWAILTYREYEYKTEKSSSDIEGEEYSLGLDINPTLVLDLKVDNSKNQSTDNVYSAKINFVYPPKENKKTMVDGFSEDRYEKENMKDKLRAKVIRNNRLVIEQQGAVIFTQK